MKSLEESVVTTMDGTDKEIFPYLSYILQDFWEIGSSASDMIALIEKHSTDYSKLKMLDLGCGKGAVSVKIAEKLRSECWGIDGIADFIEYANNKAIEYNVDLLCHFEQADIREKIKELPMFDVVILGAVGQVFGSYYDTLTALRKCLKKGGLILIDDAYIEDSSSFTHPVIIRRSEQLAQIDRAGMKVIDELFAGREETETHEQEFDYVRLRCNELIEKYPENKSLFEGYIQAQNEEYEVLDTEVVCLTMAIKEK